jgi:hypothetical protein
MLGKELRYFLTILHLLLKATYRKGLAIIFRLIIFDSITIRYYIEWSHWGLLINHL